MHGLDLHDRGTLASAFSMSRDQGLRHLLLGVLQVDVLSVVRLRPTTKPEPSEPSFDRRPKFIKPCQGFCPLVGKRAQPGDEIEVEARPPKVLASVLYLDFM